MQLRRVDSNQVFAYRHCTSAFALLVLVQAAAGDRRGLGISRLFCYIIPRSRMPEICARTTFNCNNIYDNMVTIVGLANWGLGRRSCRQQMCLRTIHDLRTFLQVPCGSRVGANRERGLLLLGPKIILVGIDNSATWFVDGMLHRQRRK